MIVIGLDPGIARTGFGLVDTGNSSTFLRAGCLTTPEDMPIESRLHLLGEDLHRIITEAQPDMAVVEHIFFGKNHKTAIAVAQARGVILYVLRHHNIPIEALTPLQIKSRLTGYGAATKTQIQAVVQQYLHLDGVPQPDDAADALAAALCATPS